VARGLFPRRSAWILAGLALGAGGAPAFAQSEKVLGKDDVAFARELYKKGWPDLAANLCETIEKAGKTTGDAAIGLKALHLDLRFDLARNEPDAIKRKDLMKTILQEKEDLIHQYPSTKMAEDTTTSLPDVYRSIGEAITVAIQKESEPGLIVQLRDEGEKIYSKAEEQFKTRIEELAADHSTPDQERNYVNLLFNLPRTYYYHSLLYPAGEWKKKDLLEKAKEGFQVFGLDYQDTLLNFEGLVLMGLADKDLGKNEDALADFDDAIKLQELFEKDANGRYLVSGDVADTISGAVLQKVLFQTELKDYAGAAETSKKYFKEIPDPYGTRLGLAVLAAQAEAELAGGDSKGADETAKLLISKDERGRWGAKGLEIQAKILGTGGGTLDPSNMLKIAAKQAELGKDVRAIEIAHQAIALARGTPKEASVGSEGYLLIGNVFLRRGPGWSMEAALAYDTAAERWPKAEKAAENVYQAMLCYSRLNGDDKRAWFKKRVDERLKTLSTQYPDSPRSFYAQIVEGSDLEREGKYLEAARIYEQVQPGTPSYLEAQYRAGNAYFRHAYGLCQAKKEGEAGQFIKQAETILKKTMTDLETAVQGTMDLEMQSRYSSTAFQSRAALAQMYLMDCVNKPADVLKILEGVDERYGDDAEKVGAAWTFRISALQKQGKLDEAVALLDTLVKRDPNSRAIGTAAGVIARALDVRAGELEKAGKAREADEQLKRAAAYYALSGRSLAKNGQARATDIAQIADRMMALALKFNEVPAKWDSFVGWQASKTREAGLWKDAEDLYAAALGLAPSYQNQVKLGRVLGFQGHYGEAATTLARLFDSEPTFTTQDAAGGPPKLNGTLIAEKRELLVAYLEWGVAALEAAIQEKDPEMYRRADSIFATIVLSLQRSAGDNPVWWHAKYQQVRSLMQQGKYQDAKLLMNTLERENTKLGTPAGLENDFKALQSELSKKVFNEPKSTTPTPPKK
jgi:tetratricopeptide (TPR) repeat protein